MFTAGLQVPLTQYNFLHWLQLHLWGKVSSSLTTNNPPFVTTVLRVSMEYVKPVPVAATDIVFVFLF
jgi:hypothetical protein